MKTKHITLLGLFVSCLLIASSCTYKQYDDSSTIKTNVSFKDDIMPVFDASCNSVGCHAAGGIAPDLSDGNAYDDLINNSQIDKVTPENSELYIRMSSTSSPMPPTGVLQYESDLVLQWIKEGALNN